MKYDIPVQLRNNQNTFSSVVWETFLVFEPTELRNSFSIINNLAFAGVNVVIVLFVQFPCLFPFHRSQLCFENAKNLLF